MQNVSSSILKNLLHCVDACSALTYLVGPAFTISPLSAIKAVKKLIGIHQLQMLLLVLDTYLLHSPL